MARPHYPREQLTPTRWHTPHSVTEFADYDIDWHYRGREGLASRENVSSISTSYGSFISRDTDSLLFSDWGLPSNVFHTVTGIELLLETQRLARIQDKTIQIWSGRNLVGENQQNLDAENTQTYGGPNSLWGVAPHNLTDISRREWGIVIDLQPHTSIPCNETVYIHRVRLRVWILEDNT